MATLWFIERVSTFTVAPRQENESLHLIIVSVLLLEITVKPQDNNSVHWTIHIGSVQLIVPCRRWAAVSADTV